MKHIMLIICFLSCSIFYVMQSAEARPEPLVNYSPELRHKYSLYDDKDAADYYKFRKGGCLEEHLGSMANDVKLTRKEPQTILLVIVIDCNAYHAIWNKLNYILVFKGKHRVARLPAPYQTSIDTVTDINQDGLNELILSAEFMGTGIHGKSAEMLQYFDGKLKIVKDFGTVLGDDCPSGNADSKGSADELFYDRKLAKFSKEKTIYSCSTDQ
jgi:hypothetical protein